MLKYRLALVPALVLGWQAAAPAAPMLQLDVTYTDGEILSGPLSADLDVLPASVQAFFTLNGATRAAAFGLDDVLASSISFGDATWSRADLESFSATFLRTDAGGLAVSALSYAYGPKDTAAVNGKIIFNFPLYVEGTDIASGEDFQYRYNSSTQDVRSVVPEVPEPSTFALAALGFAGLAVRSRRRKK